MNPLVSVLIPAYNSEKWISETLDSVLNQSWPNLEVIVVDDGSPDNTLEVARQFESKDVKVYTQENAGASAARNKAFSLCQGDFVVWLDADDLLSRDKIKNQILALEKRGSERSVASCNWGYFYHRVSKASFETTSLCKDQKPKEWLNHKMSKNLQMQTATWLVSREITELAGPWDGSLISDDDGEYFCRVILNCDNIIYEPEAFVYYRITGSGSWGSLGRSDRKLEAQWKSMQLHIQYLLSLENSESTRSACVNYLNTWAYNFKPHRLDLLREIQEKAKELGGEIYDRKQSWKWAWIESTLGPEKAVKISSKLREMKSQTRQKWDKTMYKLQT